MLPRKKGTKRPKPMPYKRAKSPAWQVCKRLPGFGSTGRISTQVRSRRVAERMERALEDLAERALLEPGYRAVLQAVVDRSLSLPVLLDHHTRGALPDLLASLQDPPLADALAPFAHGPRRAAVATLLALTPPRARLSLLRDPRAVRAILVRLEAGEPEGKPRLRNSVRRTFLQLISAVLKAELGRAERDKVLAGLDYAGVDDTREVILSPAEIARLLETAERMGYGALALGARLAMLTSADRGTIFAGTAGSKPCRGLLVRDLEIFAEVDGTYSGTVMIHDRKTRHRTRTVPLTDGLCRLLIASTVGQGPDVPALPLRYEQVDVLWQRVREAAGLPGLRFKDLRSLTAIYGERAGVPLTVMARAMGHGDEATTRRYAQHRAVISPSQVAAIERAMGLAA